MLNYIKSNIGTRRRFLNIFESANNVEAMIQKHTQFGQRNNDKHEKPLKFANVAINKNVNQLIPVPVTLRAATITESDYEYEEIDSFAGLPGQQRTVDH